MKAKYKARKRLLIILVIGLGLIIIAYVIYLASTGKMSFLAAPGDVTLSLSPNTGSYKVGDTFTTQIVINTGTKYLTSVDINKLHYNPNLLEVQDADTSKTGIQVSQGTIFPNFIINSVDPVTGQIKIVSQVPLSQTQEPAAGFNGVGVIATINFNVLSSGTANLTFDYIADTATECNAWEAGGYFDVLTGTTGANYTLVYSTSVNLTLAIPGRKNYDTNAIFKVYPVGQRTTTLFTKNDISTDTSGKTTFQITGVSSGNYDFELAVPYCLKTILTNVPLSNSTTLVLNYPYIKLGDLLYDNGINAGDYTYFSGKWLTNDPVTDINRDGSVNGGDFNIMNNHWWDQGDK